MNPKPKGMRISLATFAAFVVLTVILSQAGIAMAAGPPESGGSDSERNTPPVQVNDGGSAQDHAAPDTTSGSSAQRVDVLPGPGGGDPGGSGGLPGPPDHTGPPEGGSNGGSGDSGGSSGSSESSGGAGGGSSGTSSGSSSAATGVLPYTGSQTLGLVFLIFVFLAMGGLATVLGRRRALTAVRH